MRKEKLRNLYFLLPSHQSRSGWVKCLWPLPEKKITCVHVHSCLSLKETPDHLYKVLAPLCPFEDDREARPKHSTKLFCLTWIVINILVDITIELVSLRCCLCGSISNSIFFPKAAFHRVLITSFSSVYVLHLGLVFLQKLFTLFFPNYFIA